MPKLRKDQKDEVIRLIEQGFLDIEIKEKTKINTKTISKMRKALNKAQTSNSKDRTIFPRHTLTIEQTLRLLGICHLEGGKDPNTVMTELLEGEAKYRKRSKDPFELHPKQIMFLEKDTGKKADLYDWLQDINSCIELIFAAFNKYKIEF